MFGLLVSDGESSRPDQTHKYGQGWLLHSINFHVDIFKSNKIRVSRQFKAGLKGSARNEIKDRFTFGLTSAFRADLPSLYFPESTSWLNV